VEAELWLEGVLHEKVSVSRPDPYLTASASLERRQGTRYHVPSRMK